MDRAAELLRKTNASLAEVARTVGIDDLNLFHKRFKKVFAFTPKTYRDEMKSLS